MNVLINYANKYLAAKMIGQINECFEDDGILFICPVLVELKNKEKVLINREDIIKQLG